MARPKGFKLIFKSDKTTKFTADTLKKLEEASSVRLSIKSVCAYAGISRDTYYRWMKDIKGLSDRLEDLREHPIMKAKRTIVSKLDDVTVAFRYLEKEEPEEYGERLKLEHSGEVIGGTAEPEDAEAIKLFHDTLKENMRKRNELKLKKPNENTIGTTT